MKSTPAHDSPPSAGCSCPSLFRPQIEFAIGAALAPDRYRLRARWRSLVAAASRGETDPRAMGATPASISNDRPIVVRPGRRICPASTTTSRCRSTPVVRRSPPPSRTTKWSSSAAKPARANRPNCPRSAWRSDAAWTDSSATRSRVGSPPARLPRGWPRNCDHAAGPGCRFQDPLHRPHATGNLRQVDDRRDPAGRNADRPVSESVRHDHPGRSPRAVAEHRLSARLSPAPAAEATGTAVHHHVGHDRRRTVSRSLRCR